jgi:hypothetical protein
MGTGEAQRRFRKLHPPIVPKTANQDNGFEGGNRSSLSERARSSNFLNGILGNLQSQSLS